MKNISMIFIILFSILSSAEAQQSTLKPLEQKADSLFEQLQEKEALQAYERLLEEDPDNFEALWKASLLYSRVGFRLEDEDDQRKYYEKAKSLAEKALAMDSTHTQSHFVMSVALGREALISSPRDRLRAAKAIKKHADRSLRADSTNPGAWHVLGRWHFKIANLNFFERLAANALYGGLPDDASNKKAEQAIENAIQLNSRYPLYYYDLARIYDELGKEELAMKTCRKALKLNPMGPDDEKHKKSCRELINELQ